MDIASYSGWEIHMRTKRKDIHVIMLRRKYIPPLLDVFVDFVVVVEGPESDFPGDGALDFASTNEILSIGRGVADSIHPQFVTDTIYKSLIEKRAHSLYYDN